MITCCPACGFEVIEPEPEWVAEREVLEELCDPCARELHGDDDSRVP